jgi:sec-independent protein translocase protein TatA
MVPEIILFLDSIGGGEILLIMFVVLLFFGSKSIPEVAKGLGKGMREVRNAMNDVRSEIENSVNTMDEKKSSETEKKKEENLEEKPLEDTPKGTSEYQPPQRKVFGQENTDEIK